MTAGQAPMTVDPASEPVRRPQESTENQPSVDLQARRLVRSARKGFLGTLEKNGGHPYVSLITVASKTDGSPAFLISGLAVHTQNLLADARCSLLIDGTSEDGDPLAGGRVSLSGQARPVQCDRVRARFLARHPEAAGYAGFSDFSFYEMSVEKAHFIGGFGRIVTLDGAKLVLDLAGADGLAAAEDEIVAHMNEDHLDAVQLYATVLKGAPPADWTMTGIDPEGIDLMAPGGLSARLEFDQLVTDANEARQALIRLVKEARSLTAASSD